MPFCSASARNEIALACPLAIAILSYSNEYASIPISIPSGSGFDKLRSRVRICTRESGDNNRGLRRSTSMLLTVFFSFTASCFASIGFCPRRME